MKIENYTSQRHFFFTKSSLNTLNDMKLVTKVSIRLLVSFLLVLPYPLLETHHQTNPEIPGQSQNCHLNSRPKSLAITSSIDHESSAVIQCSSISFGCCKFMYCCKRLHLLPRTLSNPSSQWLKDSFGHQKCHWSGENGVDLRWFTIWPRRMERHLSRILFDGV